MFCIIPIHDLANYDSIINIFQPLSESNKVQRYVQGKKYRRSILALTYHIYHLYSRMIKQVRSLQKVVDFLRFLYILKETTTLDKFDVYSKYKMPL